MRIAYLVNQYPKVSHTFIRREIHALEARGLTVLRFAARTVPGELVDPQDLAELGRTRALLDAGAPAFALALLRTAATRPRAFAAALRTALRLGARSERGRLRHLIYLAEACLLRRWLGEAGVDHLHVHFGTNSAAVALLTQQLGGPGYSLTVHGPEEFDMPSSLSLATKLAQARFVVAISSFCRSQLFRWADPSVWRRVVEVHCALDSDYFDGPPVAVPEAPRFVCVGRLAPEKGQLLLLQAVARVRARGIALALTLAGDGPDRAALEAEITRLGLADAVTITGWVDNTRVRELLLQSRGLVLASFAEGLPVVIMEALALRRPVVATTIAGIPELVRPGDSGWLVAPGDVDALAEALADAAQRPAAELGEMGARGHARALERHDAAREAERLHAHFQAAVAAGGGAPAAAAGLAMQARAGG